MSNKEKKREYVEIPWDDVIHIPDFLRDPLEKVKRWIDTLPFPSKKREEYKERLEGLRGQHKENNVNSR